MSRRYKFHLFSFHYSVFQPFFLSPLSLKILNCIVGKNYFLVMGLPQQEKEQSALSSAQDVQHSASPAWLHSATTSSSRPHEPQV
jgi:hypothetical protein